MDLTEKLQRLMRMHRQRVFDANGAGHTRALHRLKRTKTFLAMAERNRAAERVRQGERYAGMGY